MVQTICVSTVPSPCPMQDAPERIWSLPSLTATMQRPVSGMPTPTPAFFIAQAMPTFLFCSQMSFTASSVSTRPVDGGAICPFGSVCPGRMALR
jgi:hypothetical protein